MHEYSEQVRELRIEVAKLAYQVAELRTNRALKAAEAASAPRLVN